MSYGRTVNKRKIGINSSQLALIHVAKKKLNLQDEDYRGILELYGGVSSAKFLMLEGFERVMAHLVRLGFEIKPATTQKGKGHKQTVYRASDTLRSDPNALKTPAQDTMIAHYFDTLGWPEAQRRQKFCQRMIKKAWPQTRDEAVKVIEALKAMVARMNKMQ